jgi:hypothetical protein
MNAEVFAEWLRRQGRRVLRTESSYWHGEDWGTLQAFPYHWQIQPSKRELRDLVVHHRAVALRFSAPSETTRHPKSYHVLCMKKDYDLDCLSGWGRKNVRRGLRNCNVERISFARYLEEGWTLRADTLDRQRRRSRDNRDAWHKRFLAAADLQGFEIWAALVGNKLAATLVTFRMEDFCYMILHQCHRDYLRDHVNNALSYVVTGEMIRRPEIRGIFYGMSSLDAAPSVDEFKLRMGYEAKGVRQRVLFHPFLSPLVNRLGHGLLKTMLDLNPNNRFFSKTDGLVRLYLDEKQAGLREAGARL